VELFLIYLWLKLDAFRTGSITAFIVMAVFGMCWLIFAGIESPMFDVEKYWANQKRLFNTYAKLPVIIITSLFLFSWILPTSRQTAILVGSYVALDIIKSPEGEKIGKLVRQKANEFLDKELSTVVK